MIHRYFATTLGADHREPARLGAAVPQGSAASRSCPVALLFVRRVPAGRARRVDGDPAAQALDRHGAPAWAASPLWACCGGCRSSPETRQLTRARDRRCANLRWWVLPCWCCKSPSAAGPAPTMRRWPARIFPPASTPGGRRWTFATPSCCGADSTSTYEGGVLANPARVAIHFTHRLGALVAGSILISLGARWPLRRRRARAPASARAGRLLMLAVAAADFASAWRSCIGACP